MNRRVAAIDFGTNTARLLVVDRSGNRFEPLCLDREIVRMGGGFCRERGLSPEAWERGLSCLKRFAARIGQIGGCHDIRAVATSAVRDACNGAGFVEAVRRETGICLEVIDGIREGALTLKGVLAGLDEPHDEIVLFDVGGGSTEYTLARMGEAVFIRSLPLGVVRLTEGKGEPAAMRDKIRRELAGLQAELDRAGRLCTRDAVLIGTAGTATTLAAICLGLREYDHRLVNNAVVSRGQIEAVYERLLPMAPAERLQVPGLEKGREDLIIAGILITLETMEMTGQSCLKVSDYGLLEGLVVSG